MAAHLRRAEGARDVTSPHRKRRREQVAEYARASGLDGVLVHSWHRQSVAWLTGYAPGYVTNQSALWLGADDTEQMGVRFQWDVVRAEASSGLRVETVERATRLVPHSARRIGLIAGDTAVDETTPAMLEDLRAAGIEYVDLRGWLDELQESKLPEEVEALRHAGEVASSAFDACGTAPAVGRTDWDVVADVEAVARRAGARRGVCLVGIGPGAVVSECSGRTIGTGDAVCLEFTLYVDEWCMHVNTQLDGGDAESVALQDVCAKARLAMLDAMAVGMPIDELVAIGDAVLEDAGVLAHKEYDFGHGLGADTPAHPRLLPDTGRSLILDSVLALHVAVRVPDGPTGFVGGPVHLQSGGAIELNPDAPWATRTAAIRNQP